MINTDNAKKQLENDLIKQIIKQQWKYASTYDETAPHEYILMQWNEKLFRDICDYVSRYGEDTLYYKSPVRYGYIGNYRYWHYDTFESDSVLNRALDIPEHLGTGNYTVEMRTKYMKEKYVNGQA